MKEFSVQITKSASLIAFTKIKATSPMKAKTIAEYEASKSPEQFEWLPGSAMRGSRMIVEILETEEIN